MRRLHPTVVLVLSCVATPAIAQRVSPVSFGVSLAAAPAMTGRSLPYETGGQIAAFGEIPRVLGRLSVRGEVSLAAFERNTLNGALSRRTSIPGAALYVALPLLAESAGVRPHLLAGAGSYRTEVGGGSADLALGIAGGGGVQFGRGRVRPFAEVRMLQINDGSTPRLVPVSLGLRF